MKKIILAVAVGMALFGVAASAGVEVVKGPVAVGKVIAAEIPAPGNPGEVEEIYLGEESLSGKSACELMSEYENSRPARRLSPIKSFCRVM